MKFVRSGLAVAAGFLVFSMLFAVLGPGLGAILTTIPAGFMAGYLTARLSRAHELMHGAATAGLVAASLIAQSVLTLSGRLLIAVLAVSAITAGAWLRAHARADHVDPGQTGSEERS